MELLQIIVLIITLIAALPGIWRFIREVYIILLLSRDNIEITFKKPSGELITLNFGKKNEEEVKEFLDNFERLLK